jgi:hypothetical protein
MYIIVAPSTNTIFNGTTVGDVVVYTQSNTQDIYVGNATNTTASLVMSSNITTLNNVFVYPTRPAFRASLTVAQTVTSPAVLMNFGTVNYDIGNNYNTTTKAYTVPYTGLWNVEIQMGSSAQGAAASRLMGTIELRVNGASVTNGFILIVSDGTYLSSSGTLSDFLRLNAGDVITVYASSVYFALNMTYGRFGMVFMG